LYGLWLKAERRIFTNFHRQVFCWTDLWYGLTMADIRAIEDKTKHELDEVYFLPSAYTHQLTSVLTVILQVNLLPSVL